MSTEKADLESATRDVDLVLRAQSGDMLAVELLYAKYARFVRWRAVQVGAGDDVEDVLQELFCRLAEGRDWHVRVDDTPADGQLFQLIAMMTKSLAHARPWRAKYHGTFPEHVSDLAPLWQSPNESPEDRALRLERAARLTAAFGALPQHLRKIARLRYLECLSGREIAARLGLSAATIPGYLAAIRDRVRPALSLVFSLPERGGYGHVRLDRQDRPRTTAQSNYNAKRRRSRAIARHDDSVQHPA